MHRVPLLMAAVFMTFACSPDKGFGESREVEAEDYGSDWPLTVESAILSCSPEGDLFVQINGRAFGLNTATVEDADPGFRRVWAANPGNGGERMDLVPLIEDARELCE
ncbi:YebY family protein [Nocardioides panacisoli]|uniref:DUF2511 domain-containing protein n=1 Tax=Nocardioides panacisoli TaxID=627624 RepID=UPI001C63855F|nr:DUF2511 domain-containing protein [Nocardioides panacisoli]QYJ05245.1 YebY family protein [Nocardioides panacisoli]